MSAGYDDAAVRAMRDQVFEVPTTDKNWDACREKWMRTDSVEWLQREAQKKTGVVQLLTMEAKP